MSSRFQFALARPAPGAPGRRPGVPGVDLVLALAAFVIGGLAPAGAGAQPLQCDIDGKSVNPANGSTTAGKTGLMRCRYENGRIQREEELKDGQSIGLRRFYKDDGTVDEFTVNAQGNRDGAARELYPDSKVKSEGMYRNATRIGLGKWYFPDGRIERLAYAADGKTVSSITYAQNAQIKELQCGDRTYFPEDRSPCGFDGRASDVPLWGGPAHALRRTGRVSYREGKLVSSEALDASGRLARTLDIADGIETSREFSAGRDGEIRIGDATKPVRERVVDRGRDTVIEREWAANGQLVSQRALRGGYETEATQWYMNGQKKETTRTTGTGRAAQSGGERYWDNGKLKARFALRNGRPVGVQQGYDENGTLREEATHDERGVLVARKQYDAAGKLTADDEFFEDGSRKSRK